MNSCTVTHNIIRPRNLKNEANWTLMSDFFNFSLKSCNSIVGLISFIFVQVRSRPINIDPTAISSV